MSLAEEWLKANWGESVSQLFPQTLEYLNGAANYALERAAQECENKGSLKRMYYAGLIRALKSE